MQRKFLNFFKSNSVNHTQVGPFDIMPKEVVSYLFNFFSDDKDLVRISSVNKKFRQIIKPIAEKKWQPEAINAFDTLSKHFHNLSEIKKLLWQINSYAEQWIAASPNLIDQYRNHAIILMQLYKAMCFLQKNYNHINFEEPTLVKRENKITHQFSPITSSNYADKVGLLWASYHKQESCKDFITYLSNIIEKSFAHSESKFAAKFLRDRKVNNLIIDLKKTFLKFQDIHTYQNVPEKPRP